MTTKISATVLSDSLNEFGNRITTFKLVFPRFILAELNTHRIFSRNSASSRAIPFKTMLKQVTSDPFIPIAWQKDHKGMQGKEYLTGEEVDIAINTWRMAAKNACKEASYLNRGVTKQLCNRLLEPFLWHTVIVTATEFENFFKQRCPQYSIRCDGGGRLFRSKKDIYDEYGDPDDERSQMTVVDWLSKNQGQSEIHMMELAECMWDAINASSPKQLTGGEWHTPFGDQMDVDALKDLIADCMGGLDTDVEEFEQQIEAQLPQMIIKIASARCARISYNTFEGEIDYMKDLNLHDRLIKSGHWSPFEHCARAMDGFEIKQAFRSELDHDNIQTFKYGWCRNFEGFIQYRSLLDNQSA